MTWPAIALGDIFEIARGGSPRPIEAYLTDDPDGLNWVLIGDATRSTKYIRATEKRIKRTGLKKTRAVEPGDFLLSNSMSFGRPYIMATHGCIHDGWLVLKNGSRHADPDYLYHLLGSEPVYREFVKRAPGTTVKNLNTEIVSETRIPLPPLPEQRRVAAILDQADALRTKCASAVACIGRLGGSRLNEIMGGSRDQIALSAFARIIMGQSPPGGSYNRAGDGIPLLNGPTEFGERYPTAEQWTTQPTKLAQPGDILICVRGATAGRTNVADRQYCIGRGLAAITVSPQHREFLLRVLNAGYDWFQDRGTGSTFINITAELLGLFPLPVLTEAETMDFAEWADQRQAAHASLTTRMMQSEALFHSLQHRAFRGEL